LIVPSQVDVDDTCDRSGTNDFLLLVLHIKVEVI
jgi:hypothetical protein